MMRATSARIHSAPRFLSNAASAAILVPSMAIVPTDTSPAAAHNRSTSEKLASISASWSMTKRAMVAWSGVVLPQITRNAASVRHAASIRRDERSPVP